MAKTTYFSGTLLRKKLASAKARNAIVKTMSDVCGRRTSCQDSAGSSSNPHGSGCACAKSKPGARLKPERIEKVRLKPRTTDASPFVPDGTHPFVVFGFSCTGTNENKPTKNSTAARRLTYFTASGERNCRAIMRALSRTARAALL